MLPVRFASSRLVLATTQQLVRTARFYTTVPPAQTVGLERKIRTNEDQEVMRRRLRYQTRKRGILETDLLLSSFTSEYLNGLSKQELVEFDSLLSNIDWDIFYWAVGKTEPPKEVAEMKVFAKLKDHARREGAKITRMPDLEDEEK